MSDEDPITRSGWFEIENMSDEMSFDLTKLFFQRRVTIPIEDVDAIVFGRPIPIKAAAKVPLRGHMPDGDYTQEFVDAGTTFDITGTVNAKGIPVQKAWVTDNVLYVEGTVCYEPEEKA